MYLVKIVPEMYWHSAFTECRKPIYAVLTYGPVKPLLGQCVVIKKLEDSRETAVYGSEYQYVGVLT